jgi:LPXTG-site transpeptidase (sortase) family protein
VVLTQPLLIASAAPQPRPYLEGQALGAYRVSVNVDLVELHASVRDRQGRFVSNLPQQNFEVYENDVRQTIRLFRREDTSVTVECVVDNSGSMCQKLPDVVADDEIFVVNFNEHVTLGLPAVIRFTAGNVGIAGHRDTLFRPLRNIRRNDLITLTWLFGEYSYRILSTRIVSPRNVAVLGPDGNETLTLCILCQSYFVVSAPDRFIVRAEGS